jgi:hypothetical protein
MYAEAHFCTFFFLFVPFPFPLICHAQDRVSQARSVTPDLPHTPREQQQHQYQQHQQHQYQQHQQQHQHQYQHQHQQSHGHNQQEAMAMKAREKLSATPAEARRFKEVVESLRREIALE